MKKRATLKTKTVTMTTLFVKISLPTLACLFAIFLLLLISRTSPQITTSNVVSTTPETDEGLHDSSAAQEDEYVYIDDPLLLPDDNITRSDLNATDNDTDNDLDADGLSPPHAIILNQTNANMFKAWIDAKSRHLHALNMNYSGFKVLNQTYNRHLLKDAKFAWIDFTEMIVNISRTISQVLYDKTQVRSFLY